LLIDLAQTAESQGATLVNYAPVTGLTHDAERFVNGLTFTDVETGRHHEIRARCVINATGPFCDAIRRLDEPDAQAMIAPSQGVHIVLDQSFLPGDAAIMVPRTSDGRVMFAIPWHEHTLIGTTDTPISTPTLEPIAMQDEITFLIETAGQYLSKRPSRADILSVFTGIRPLVRAKKSARTSSLNREHTIHVSDSGLLTIAGGKWTTYRKMAEDCVDHAAMLAKVPEKPCVTKSLKIHQSPADSMKGLSEESLPSLVSVAVKHEMARTVEDVLARRSRALFLDARAAIKMAPRVAELMAVELGRDQRWREVQVAAFNAIASNYLVDSNG
jgi:glycerol-3-phosphate dehydrogenase